MSETKQETHKCQLCEKESVGHCSGCNPQEPKTDYYYCDDHLNMHGCRMDEPCSVCGEK